MCVPAENVMLNQEGLPTILDAMAIGGPVAPHYVEHSRFEILWFRACDNFLPNQ